MLKQQIFRSPFQSFAAIMVVTLSLFLICASVFLGLGLDTTLKYFEAKPQVSAFLRDEIKSEEIELLKDKVNGLGGVSGIEYISKEGALKIYQEQNKDKPLLLEMVTEKTLPASLEITTGNLGDLKKVAELLKQEPMVEDVIFQEDVVASLSKWLVTLRTGALAFGGYLVAMSILVVLVILGMKVSQRREELEILKLLGASNWYIRRPFLFEGMIYGAIAALFSWVLIYAIILIETPYLSAFLSGIIVFPLPLILLLSILGGLVLTGTFIGLIGGWLAVARFGRSIR